MRILPAFACLALFAACSTDPTIDELSDNSQVFLCEDFLDVYCAPAVIDTGFCNDACIQTSCEEAMLGGHIDFECLNVFDFEVDDCADNGDPNSLACEPFNGGCMIDALEAVCP